jgi:hypothetical protein
MNLALIANRIEIVFWNVLIALGTRASSRKRRRISIPVVVSLALLVLVGLTLAASISAPHLAGHKRNSGQPWIVAADSMALRPGNGQQNLLIVLVDHLAKQVQSDGETLSQRQPTLDGVWLVAYIPGRAHLTFIPIYPFTYSGENAQVEELAGSFGLEANGKPSSGFQKSVRDQGVWWNQYLVLDRGSLSEVIELAGGVNLGYGRLSGAEVASLLATVREDARAAIGLQAMIAQQVCNSGQYIYQNVNPGIMAGLILDGARSDLRTDEFIAGWLGLRDPQGGLTCEIP